MTSGERKNGPGGTVPVFGPESGTFPLRSTTTPRRNESPCVGRQPQPCRHCCPFTGPWTTSMRRPAWRITSRQPTTTINNLRDTSGVIPIVGQAANWRALQFAAGQFPADRVSIGGRSQPTHSRVGDSTKPTMTCNYIPAKTVKVFFFVRRLVPATRDVRNPRSWWRGQTSPSDWFLGEYDCPRPRRDSRRRHAGHRVPPARPLVAPVKCRVLADSAITGVSKKAEKASEAPAVVYLVTPIGREIGQKPHSESADNDNARIA